MKSSEKRHQRKKGGKENRWTDIHKERKTGRKTGGLTYTKRERREGKQVD